MKYIKDIDNRATFNKSGNIKLGNTWNFSTVYGDEIKTVFFNGATHSARGTCGKYCQGCKNACYVKKSYRYPSVIYSHIKNTIAMRVDTAAAFHDLNAAIVNAHKKPEIIRINQSGEIESAEIFRGWCDLAANHKNIKFWLYTKNYDVIIPALLAGDVPKNMTVIISIWHDYGVNEYKKVAHLANVKAFIYDDGYNYNAAGLEIQTYCNAYKPDKNGKMQLNHNLTCEKCRKCFNRSANNKIIGSLPH